MENPSRKLSSLRIMWYRTQFWNEVLLDVLFSCYSTGKEGEGDKENYLRHVTGVSHDLSHDVTNTSILECQFLCCMPATRLFFLQCWYLNSEILLNRFDEKGRFPFNTVSKPEDSSKTLEPPTFCLPVIKIHLFLDLLCWDSTSCIFGNFRVNQTWSSLQLLTFSDTQFD